MTTKQIGRKLKQARRGRGVSREALAAKVGVSLRTLESIEAGAEGSHLATVLRLAKILGVRL